MTCSRVVRTGVRATGAAAVLLTVASGAFAQVVPPAEASHEDVDAAKSEDDGLRRTEGKGGRPAIPSGARDLRDLTKRADKTRPDDQLTVEWLGRSLTVGGEYQVETEFDARHDPNQEANLDQVQMQHQLQLELTYGLFASATLYAEAKIHYDFDLLRQSGSRQSMIAVERGETWLHVPLWDQGRWSLQVGRQSFKDKREWWWDEDLDALRIAHEGEQTLVELAIAQEFLRQSTDEAFLDPEERGVLRLVGHARWEYAPSHKASIFLLIQDDRSKAEAPGSSVASNREDEVDADMLWLGLRARGKFRFHSGQVLKYWLDGGMARGTERLRDFDDLAAGGSVVSSVTVQRVRGWAIDVGFSWQHSGPGRPYLTLSYARGSGDSRPGDGHDHSFRQSGLQGNSAKFLGTERLGSYGELLDPELSNLQVVTAGIGIRLLESSSLDLVFHHYSQLEADPLLRNSQIEFRPEGRFTSLGNELDLVLAIEESKRFELTAIGSVFRSGRAFGRLRGKNDYALSLKLEFPF